MEKSDYNPIHNAAFTPATTMMNSVATASPTAAAAHGFKQILQKKKKKSKTEEEELTANYEPGAYDVLCGRGKSALNHIGNRRFRAVVACNLSRYLALKSRSEKTHLAMRIVANVRNNGGRFLKQDPHTHIWYEIGDKMAREKVAHALRDAKADRSLKKPASPPLHPQAELIRAHHGNSNAIRDYSSSEPSPQTQHPYVAPKPPRRDPDGDSQFCDPPVGNRAKAMTGESNVNNGNKADMSAITIADILLHLSMPRVSKDDPPSIQGAQGSSSSSSTSAAPSQMVKA